MKYGAYGLVEVVGEANGILVTDRMLKTAEVEYVTQDTKRFGSDVSGGQCEGRSAVPGGKDSSHIKSVTGDGGYC